MMSYSISGKKILFICPKFIGYDLAIKNEMENLGAQVTMCSDRPYNGFYDFFKNLNIYLVKFYQIIIFFFRSIHLKLLDYDAIFVIRGEHIPDFFLKKVEKSIKKRVLYEWDSVSNYNYLAQLKYYNKVYTFDRTDASKYNLTYLPLFYRREYERKQDKLQKDLKALFIGTFQIKRYQSVQNIIAKLKELDIVSTVKFRIPYYYYIKLLIKGFKVDRDLLTFTNVSFNDLIRLYSEVHIIIDVANENQTGLTMRTFEALGANKELITNNKSIVLEPFYMPQHTKDLGDNFKWLKKADATIREQRIDGWIIKIFN